MTQNNNKMQKKYYVKAGKVNEAFQVMKKKMINDLDDFRVKIIMPLLLNKEKEDEHTK